MQSLVWHYTSPRFFVPISLSLSLLQCLLSHTSALLDDQRPAEHQSSTPCVSLLIFDIIRSPLNSWIIANMTNMYKVYKGTFFIYSFVRNTFFVRFFFVLILLIKLREKCPGGQCYIGVVNASYHFIASSPPKNLSEGSLLSWAHVGIFFCLNFLNADNTWKFQDCPWQQESYFFASFLCVSSFNVLVWGQILCNI